MSQKLVFAKISLKTRYMVRDTMSTLRHMSTSAILIALTLISFNCRATVKSLIHIKHVKNANHLGMFEIENGQTKTSQQVS